MPWDKSLYPRSWPLIAGTLKAIALMNWLATKYPDHLNRPTQNTRED